MSALERAHEELAAGDPQTAQLFALLSIAESLEELAREPEKYVWTMR